MCDLQPVSKYEYVSFLVICIYHLNSHYCQRVNMNEPVNRHSKKVKLNYCTFLFGISGTYPSIETCCVSFLSHFRSYQCMPNIQAVTETCQKKGLLISFTTTTTAARSAVGNEKKSVVSRTSFYFLAFRARWKPFLFTV